MQGDNVCRGRRLQTGNGIAIPSGVDDAQVSALQHQRLRVEKGNQRRFLRGGITLPRRVNACIARGAAVKKPAAAVFRVIQQQVDFMVAEDGLRPAPRVQTLVPGQHARHVRPAIDQIAEEDEVPPLRMRAVVVITEMGEQRLQRRVLAVDVADDVEFAVRQGLDARHRYFNRLKGSLCSMRELYIHMSARGVCIIALVAVQRDRRHAQHDVAQTDTAFSGRPWRCGICARVRGA